MKYGRRKKKIEEDDLDVPVKKTIEIDGMTFKTRADYTYFLKLLDFEEKGIIESFDRSHFLVNEEEQEEIQDDGKDDEQKYKAKKVIVNNIKFDSRLETDYYLHLLILQQEGEIE
jgi:hypothetical protein